MFKTWPVCSQRSHQIPGIPSEAAQKKRLLTYEQMLGIGIATARRSEYHRFTDNPPSIWLECFF